MTTYSLISHNLLKLNNTNFFSLNYKEDGIDGILKIFFSQFLSKKYSIKNKYIFFKETLENFLIKNFKEKIFINYFCQIQKIYKILNKFIYNYKFKKAKIVVNKDMCLNDLNISDKNVICVYHNNSKYLFLINELVKIINSALTNSSSFFASPKSIKNPYDNIAFNKSTLYNIYFSIKNNKEFSDYKAEFLFKFFESDFNLSIFKCNNEFLLRNYTIKNYVYQSSSNIILDEIKLMIQYFNLYCIDKRLKNKIKIDIGFPKYKLIKIMQPYLLLYIKSQYSYLVHEQKESLFLLNKCLINFNNYNSNFGRKRYKIFFKYKNLKKIIIKKIVDFDDKHLKFNDVESQNKNFLSDHLNYDENHSNFRLIYRDSFYFNEQGESEQEESEQEESEHGESEQGESEQGESESNSEEEEFIEENNDIDLFIFNENNINNEYDEFEQDSLS